MITIRGANVNEVFPVGMLYLREQGERRDSRNGWVTEIMQPVSVTYDIPMERVLFNKERDCNPFFHLFESLWMLAGHKDVAFLEQYNSRMKEYSDDGIGFNAAYGHRLRSGFDFDQLEEVIKRLQNDHNDRRAVLQLWDCHDLRKDSKDYACNLVITPRIRHNKLDWTVFNRSNDYLWGMLGANAVHMSIFQEYVAAKVGVPMGSYTQITNCLHAYTDLPVWKACENVDLASAKYGNHYRNLVSPTPIITEPNYFDEELTYWMQNPTHKNDYINKFFTDVAVPMALIHRLHKENKSGGRHVGSIKGSDWKYACTQWLHKREYPDTVQSARGD